MSIQDSNIHTRTEIPDVLAASGYQEMLNQREEKTGAWLSGHGTYDIGKWSDFFPVCGKIVVKRKITAKLAVIFLKNGGPNRDRTDDLTDANRTLSQSGKFSANGLRCMVCQKLIIQHLQKQKFAMAFSIDL